MMTANKVTPDEDAQAAHPSQEPSQSGELPSTSSVTAKEAKDALTKFVSEKRYGKGPLEKIEINDLKSSSAFHYTLESYCESRSTSWRTEPYNGCDVFTRSPPHNPSDIKVEAPEMFVTDFVQIEIPNTATLKPCGDCNAKGSKQCGYCQGRGYSKCMQCDGSGFYHDEVCPNCNRGKIACYNCRSQGQMKCNNCDGRSNLKVCNQLNVVWNNHVDHHVVDKTNLPDELIKEASGEKALEETSQTVRPVKHFPEQEINDASKALVDTHATKFSSELMLMQRQRVEIVPVTEVFYKYKEKNSSFFVYGLERKVHFPDYPSQGCSCCSVL